MDIVERLRQFNVGNVPCLSKDAADEIERLRDEVMMWRERYEAERRDHEATIRHADEMMGDP